VCCLPSASMCAECTICSSPTPTEDCSYASCKCGVKGGRDEGGKKERGRKERGRKSVDGRRKEGTKVRLGE
jgi:hypothetical protein